METLQFNNHENSNGGYIDATFNNDEAGRLTYTLMPENNILIITFVSVKPKYNGKGYGKALVEEAVKLAREKHYKINPHCSFSRSVLLRMENINDVYP